MSPIVRDLDVVPRFGRKPGDLLLREAIAHPSPVHRNNLAHDKIVQPGDLVEVHVCECEGVRISGDSNLIDNVETYVEGDTLVIDTEGWLKNSFSAALEMEPFCAV